jgi:hypothetical protein
MTMREVQGWMTNDGTFYEYEEQAHYHEQLVALRKAIATSIHFAIGTQLDHGRIVAFIQQHPDIIIEFCYAYKSCNSDRFEEAAPEIIKVIDYAADAVRSQDHTKAEDEEPLDRSRRRGLATTRLASEMPHENLENPGTERNHQRLEKSRTGSIV